MFCDGNNPIFCNGKAEFVAFSAQLMPGLVRPLSATPKRGHKPIYPAKIRSEVVPEFAMKYSEYMPSAVCATTFKGSRVAVVTGAVAQ